MIVSFRKYDTGMFLLQFDAEYVFALKIIGYIGVAISLIALSLTVLIYVCLR